MTPEMLDRLNPFRDEALKRGIPCADVERWITATARPCATLSPDGDGPVVGQFGGSLALPAGVPDPYYPLLATIDCAAIPGEATDIPLPPLPPLPPAPPCRVDREVEDGDVLEFGDGAVVVAVPGHTDGSIALHLPGPRALFAGDAVANVGRTMLGVFNTDRARAVESLHRLAKLEIDTAVFGHGDPISHGAAAALQGAAASAV